MEVLLTAFQLLLCGVGVYGAYRTLQSEHEAAGHAKDLLQSKGRLIACEQSLIELEKRHVQLNGRVNASLHRLKREHRFDDDEQTPVSERDTARAAGQVDIDDIDPELAATLRLQQAPAGRPNGSA